MTGVRVGKVTHYFDRIGVAVLQLERPLALGDHVQFVKRGFVLFEQDITSMQVNHQNISSARAGDEVAVRVIDEVSRNTEVHKV
jgi:putative protease